MYLKITQYKVDVYKIDCPAGWANITIDASEQQGRISIASSHGNWSNYWGHCRMPFEEFLCGINMEYAADKFGCGSYLDCGATIQEIKRDLLELRRNNPNAISRETARDAWEDIYSLEGIDSADHFYTTYYYTETLSTILSSDCPTIHTSVHPQFEYFWESIWGHFVTYLKENIND